MDDEANALLVDIRELLAALPAAIASAINRQRDVPRRLSDVDLAALLELLPVTAAAVGGRPFTLRELTTHARLNVAPAIALREALIEFDLRRLGRLLRRAADVGGVDGFLVTARKSTRYGVQWRVESVMTDHHKPAKLALPRKAV